MSDSGGQHSGGRTEDASPQKTRLVGHVDVHVRAKGTCQGPEQVLLCGARDRRACAPRASAAGSLPCSADGAREGETRQGEGEHVSSFLSLVLQPPQPRPRSGLCARTRAVFLSLVMTSPEAGAPVTRAGTRPGTRVWSQNKGRGKCQSAPGRSGCFQKALFLFFQEMVNVTL